VFAHAWGRYEGSKFSCMIFLEIPKMVRSGCLDIFIYILI
jgi:hypothetical protein